nr:tetratricopeptide repeat protein [Actinokineospora enzanensis]
MNTRDEHDDQPEPHESGAENRWSGSGSGVVQAGNVTGGVHFYQHGPSASPIPRQLPTGSRIFVNRQADIEWLDSILEPAERASSFGPLCIVVGTAGVGKTSLAVEWAQRVRDNFADGQLYINLHGYDPGPSLTAAAALEQLLRALDVAGGSIPADLEARAALYRSLVADRSMLLLLDNAASVGQVRPLLPGTTRCLVLVTSRNLLSGLVSREGAYRRTLGVLSESESIDLVRATVQGHRSTDSDEDIAELARLCAHLPLALRIAAERAASRPLLPLSDLVQDLHDESGLWDLLDSDDDEQGDAVRSVFAWSYRALAPDAARVFRLLGLHPTAEFSSLAAAALAGMRRQPARQALAALSAAHLLEQRTRTRYQFHDLLRAYASDQVQHEEDQAGIHAAVGRLLSWYLHTTDSAVTASQYQDRSFEIEPPADMVEAEAFVGHNEAVEWLELEEGNLVAMAALAAQLGFHTPGWQIPALLRNVYAFRHPFDSWQAITRTGLVSARRAGNRFAEAYLLHGLGTAMLHADRLGDALSEFERALTIQVDIGDRRGEVETSTRVGQIYQRLRRLDEARDRLERARDTARASGDVEHAAFATHLLGEVHVQLDLPGRAVELLREAVESLRRIEEQTLEIDALVSLCDALREAGLLDEALGTAHTTLETATDLNDDVIVACVLIELGKIQLALDRVDESLISFQRAAVLQRKLGNTRHEARALDGTGAAYRRLERFAEAAEFHRRAATMFRQVGDDWRTAGALVGLGVALRRNGRSADARAQWQDSTRILDRYPDPRAQRLRARTAALLAEVDR